jgi:hypothetical protein
MINRISPSVMAMLAMTVVGCSGSIEKNPTSKSLIELTESGFVLRTEIQGDDNAEALSECRSVAADNSLEVTCRARVSIVSEEYSISGSYTETSQYVVDGNSIRNCIRGNDFIRQMREIFSSLSIIHDGVVLSGPAKSNIVSAVLEELVLEDKIQPGSDVCTKISKTSPTSFTSVISVDGFTTPDDVTTFVPVSLNQSEFWRPTAPSPTGSSPTASKWTCEFTAREVNDPISCDVTVESNSVTFSAVGVPALTFNTSDKADGSIEVSSIESVRTGRVNAFGFCEFTANKVECHAANISYTARR